MDVSGKLVCIVRSSEFSPDPRSERLANFLRNEGAHVLQLGLNRTGRSRSRECSHGVDIHRLTLGKKYGLPVGKLTLGPYLLIWMFWVIAQLFKRKPPMIIASDLDAFVPCILFRRLVPCTLIFHPHDSYADSMEKPIPKFIVRSLRRLERATVKYADAMILPDITRSKQYWAGSLPKHIVEIVNSPEEMIETLAKPVHEYYPPDTLRVFYGGLLSRVRGLWELVEVIETEPGLHLVLAGHGEDEQELVRRLEGCRNSHFLGRIGHHEIMASTQESDVVIAMYDPSIPNHLFASPNKLFEAMACGKPVIVNSGTRLSDIVKKHNCGVVVEYGDKNALTEALRELRDGSNLRNELGSNGRKAFDAFYKWPIMEERLRGFLGNLAQSPSGGSSVTALRGRTSRSHGAELTMRTRVVIVTLYGRGGMVHYASQLANAMSQLLDVVLVLPKYADTSLVNESVRIVSLDVPSGYLESIAKSFHFGYLKRVSHQIPDLGGDVIHLLSNHPWLALLALQREREGVVVTLHDPFPHRRSTILAPFFILLNWFFGKTSDRVIVHGEKLKNDAVRLGIKANVVRVVPIGDFAFFSRLGPSPFEKSQSPKSFLFFGHVLPYKGVDVLVDAVGILRRRGVIIPVTIAGEWHDDRLLKDNARRESINVIDRYIPDAEVKSLFESAIAVVLPYRDGSQSGIVPIAFSFEKPVIATRVGSISEVVDDGLNGILIPPNDSVALADALEKMWNHPKLVEDMSGNTRTRPEHMSWSAISRKTMEIYVESIESRRGGLSDKL